MMNNIDFFKKKYVAGILLAPMYIFLVLIWTLQGMYNGIVVVLGSLLSIILVGHVYYWLVLGKLCLVFPDSKFKVVALIMLFEVMLIVLVLSFFQFA